MFPILVSRLDSPLCFGSCKHSPLFQTPIFRMTPLGYYTYILSIGGMLGSCEYCTISQMLFCWCLLSMCKTVSCPVQSVLKIIDLTCCWGELYVSLAEKWIVCNAAPEFSYLFVFQRLWNKSCKYMTAAELHQGWIWLSMFLFSSETRGIEAGWRWSESLWQILLLVKRWFVKGLD